MILSDLPQEVQQQLINERLLLHKEWFKNNSYNISFTNLDGTRYFTASRHQSSWNDGKGHYMPFGGGSQWHIRYGKILWDRSKNPGGGWDYYWVRSGKIFGKAANGTIVPQMVGTKKEVLDIAKAIGIFVMEKENKEEVKTIQG